MRTTSLKTIYLTIPELKESIAKYIQPMLENMGSENLYKHLMDNEWSMDWVSTGMEEFAISIDGEIKDEVNEEQKNKTYTAKIEYLDAANDELCIKFPEELMKQEGWEIDDEVEWEETEIGGGWDEHMGFTLVNLSKLKRIAKKEWTNATSTNME